jgi:hypothetical protein
MNFMEYEYLRVTKYNIAESFIELVDIERDTQQAIIGDSTRLLATLQKMPEGKKVGGHRITGTVRRAGTSSSMAQ